MPTIARTIPDAHTDARAIRLCEWMGDVAAEWATRPASREAAQKIFQGIDWRNVPAVAKRLEAWARDNITYEGNPPNAQVAPTAEFVWQTMRAPCTAASMLAGVLLATGNRARLVLWGSGRHYTHVFVEVWDPSARRWIVVDWVPQPGFDRRRLERGNRWEMEVEKDRHERPGRTFVQCAAGERFPKLAGVAVGVAVDDAMDALQRTVERLTRTVEEQAKDLRQRTTDALQRGTERAVKDAGEGVFQRVLPWAMLAGAGYVVWRIMENRR